MRTSDFTIEEPFAPDWRTLPGGWAWIRIQKNASCSIFEHSIDSTKPNSDGSKLVGVIRHPLDRVVSFYEMVRKWGFKSIKPGELEWEECLHQICITPDEVANPHIKTQVSFFNPMPEKLILFENLNDEFAKMGITLTKTNDNPHNYWQEYYTESQREFMSNRYIEDLKLYTKERDLITANEVNPNE